MLSGKWGGNIVHIGQRILLVNVFMDHVIEGQLDQEELQVLEHPTSLYHSTKAVLDIRDPLGTFRVCEIALISGVRYPKT